MNILGYDVLAGCLGCHHFVLGVIFKVRVQNGNTFGSMPKFLAFGGMSDMPECCFFFVVFFLLFFWGAVNSRCRDRSYAKRNNETGHERRHGLHQVKQWVTSPSTKTPLLNLVETPDD